MIPIQYQLIQNAIKNAKDDRNGDYKEAAS